MICQNAIDYDTIIGRSTLKCYELKAFIFRKMPPEAAPDSLFYGRYYDRKSMERILRVQTVVQIKNRGMERILKTADAAAESRAYGKIAGVSA